MRNPPQDEAHANGAPKMDAENVFARIFGDVQRQQQEMVEAAIDTTLAGIRNELIKAMKKHPPLHSPEEGHAVLRKQFDQLWDEVKAGRGVQQSGLHEATQVGAMAVRYIVDLFNWQLG